MSSEMLVIPFQGKGYVSAAATQVVDMYGTELPMTISTTTVNFDALTVGGEAVVGGAIVAADISDVTASATELNVLDGIAVGLTAAELSILDGVTATAVEINSVDVSAQAETIAQGGTVSVTLANTKIASTGAGAITLAAPSAAMYGRIKTIEMISGEHDVTLDLTNVVGGSAGTSALFSDIGDALSLVALTGKWQVVGESGVALS